MKLRLLLTLSLLIVFSDAFCQAVGTWQNTGPILFPVNVSGQVHGMGRVSQLKFHHANPAKIYAVSASGGLFITADTGHTWAPAPGTDLLPKTGCSAVCVDYTNDNVIYLSTGDQNYYSDWYGIYKSTDGGITWNPANTGIGNRMAIEIIMDPTNHNVLVAATSDGIWRTTNGGATWSATASTGAFKSMKQKPGSNTVLYAATDNRFFRSANMGASWTNITAGVTVPTGNQGIRIAVTPADTNIVFLGTTDGYGEILKSTNGGSSFSGVYSSTTQCLVCYDSTITSGSQGYYNFNLTVNPVNANELLLVSHCVWRSTDGGVTWSWRTQWWNQVHTDMHEILFDPYLPNLRFNANDGGVWVSTDTLATTWQTRSDGLAATEMYHAAQSPIARQVVSAGTQDNGELYFDGAWKCNRGGDWGPRCGIDNLGKGTVYYENGSRRDLAPLSGDYSYNAPFSSTPQFSIEFPPAMNTTAFVATDSVWRSRDVDAAAPAWSFMFENGETLMGIAACKADSNILYAITDNGHLLRCDNALAAAPTYVTLSLPGGTSLMASVTTNKYNANIVYATCGNQIYRSANKGASWTNISAALPAINIRKVIADDYSLTERLFICMDNYVYYKDNTTTAWTLSSGLPTVAGVSDFMIYNDSTAASILRVSTYGRGVWECNIQDNMPPAGSFTADKTYVCPGDTVRYSKVAYGNIASFAWSFPGGTPATSSANNPVVVYGAAGMYDATLTLYGGHGNDTIKRTNYIHVSKGSGTPIIEGFEGSTFLPGPEWRQHSQSGVNWNKTATVGGYGLSARCITFDNFDNDGGGRHDKIITPKVDLAYATKGYVKFDVAYAYYPGYRDTLMVEVSTDCGKTFLPVYVRDTNYLASAPDTTGFFIPTATQWRTDSISLTPYIGNSVQIAFVNVGHYGQNVYIDNVNIGLTIPPNIGVEEIATLASIRVYPNPANDIVNVKVEGMTGGKARVTCYNIMGAVVAAKEEIVLNGGFSTAFNMSHLPKGIYEVRVQDERGESLVAKVVLQ